MRLKDFEATREERAEKKRAHYTPLLADLSEPALEWMLTQNTHALEAYLYGGVVLKKDDQGYSLAVATIQNPEWNPKHTGSFIDDGEKGRVYRWLPLRMAEFDERWTEYQVWGWTEQERAKNLEEKIVLPNFREWMKRHPKGSVTPELIQAVLGGELASA